MSGYSEVIPGQAPPLYTPNPGYQQQYGSGSTHMPAASGSPGDEDDYEHALIPDRYLNLDFESCFQEHKSTKTIPIVYKVNRYVFEFTKLFFYNLFVIVFGILISFLWAVVLGTLSFILAWLLNPALKATILTVSRILPALTEPLKALLTPLVDVHARIFRQIRVRSWLEGGLMSPFAKREEHAA